MPRVAQASGRRRLAIDWPALAILVLPLVIMALLHSFLSTPQPSGRPTAWQGDLSIEAMPVFPEPTNHAHAPPPEPTPPPWHGDLSIEAMPVFPEPTNHAHAAPPEPAPPPWHGDLSIEAMPVFPEPINHAHAAPPATGEPAPPEAPALAAPEPPAVASPASKPPLAVAALPAPQCRTEPAEAPNGPHPAGFGHTLAVAAEAQIGDLVIYNARYVSLAYPGGDTAPLYGVCTDVIVRAYRALGIDFQELIHLSRLGRGDASIDHRRVEVVRRFLARHGRQLPISEFAEDYRPGDIVTYHRPEGRISQSHIAIVSDRIAPSGRPLIVHNRGWGPQMEDALFVDRITGHYRLSPEEVEAFRRTRAPRGKDRRRHTADVTGTTRR